MIKGYVTVHAVGVRDVLALVAETPKCACVFPRALPRALPL